MKKIISRIINATSVIIIIAAVAVLLIVVTTPAGKAPNILGYSVFRVMTGSMEPTLETGALIVSHKTDISKLEAGDIISFYSNDPTLDSSVNTHRIVSINTENSKTIIHTRGDANNIDDKYPVYEENLIGKVVFSSAPLGKFVAIISNPLVFVPLVLIPLFIMIIVNIVKTAKLAKKLADEEMEKEKQELIEHVKNLQEKRREEKEKEKK